MQLGIFHSVMVGTKHVVPCAQEEDSCLPGGTSQLSKSDSFRPDPLFGVRNDMLSDGVGPSTDRGSSRARALRASPARPSDGLSNSPRTSAHMRNSGSHLSPASSLRPPVSGSHLSPAASLRAPVSGGPGGGGKSPRPSASRNSEHNGAVSTRGIGKLSRFNGEGHPQDEMAVESPFALLSQKGISPTQSPAGSGYLVSL